jgi:hypothetical membrane protein
VPARIAGVCGLLAFVTFNVAWIAGALAQPSAYSVANDDISDLGAMAAASPWIYNRVGANLTDSTSIAEESTRHATTSRWHSRAHKIESGFTAAFSLLAPLILAFAFRRNPAWCDSWIPSLP